MLGCASQVCTAYSVLTHEEIVDLLWADQIKPLLLQKYPGATADQLKEAHSYAYGGSLIQDIGYYPFGSREFSDLVHYVRSGDFVVALLEEATDVNEYAFALGALSHYASDLAGHPLVNQAVANEFPKLKAKYGEHVTYAENPKAHLRTEFGFDVAQVARGRYTSDSYHDFIGFQVARPVLERAFRETYGFELKDIFFNLDLSIGTFRRAVSKTLPEMTRVALVARKQELVKEIPNLTKEKFLFNLKRADYERTWGKTYQKPSCGARLLAALIRLIPKVGPFKAMGFKIPDPATENLYFKSVNDSVSQYRTYLQQLSSGHFSLPNRDFDTGEKTQAGEYNLTDQAYVKVVNRLAKDNFASVSPALRQNLLQFFAGSRESAPPNRAPAPTKKARNEWQQALENVERLKSTDEPAVPAPPPAVDHKPKTGPGKS
ncbi:MAG: zinc dependent phospholipase C family protein [Thermoanaerobaculales bacterium]